MYFLDVCCDGKLLRDEKWTADDLGNKLLTEEFKHLQAMSEGQKLRKLMACLRCLKRNSEKGHTDRVSELKSLVEVNRAGSSGNDAWGEEDEGEAEAEEEGGEAGIDRGNDAWGEEDEGGAWPEEAEEEGVEAWIDPSNDAWGEEDEGGAWVEEAEEEEVEAWIEGDAAEDAGEASGGVEGLEGGSPPCGWRLLGTSSSPRHLHAVGATLLGTSSSPRR